MTLQHPSPPEVSVLPAEARRALVAAHALPDGIVEAASDTVLAAGIPVLVRGDARIVPIARWSGEKIPDDAENTWRGITAAGLHYAGNWSNLDLEAHRDDAIGDYTRALRAVDATAVRCWVYSKTTAIALVRSGDAASSALALHVIPAGWVFLRGPDASAAVDDLRWSWDDVADLTGEERTNSLKERRGEVEDG